MEMAEIKTGVTIPDEGIHWSLGELNAAPEEEWERMRSFLGIGDQEIQAMLATVEALLKRGHELVVGTYDYLLKNPETAAILGWEKGVDPAHLAERRRFFTVWLARVLGLDFSPELARYLFKAGQYHAGQGPRQIHVPPMYVTAAASLVHASFARFLTEEMPGDSVVPAALAGWNKVLSLHLHMMLLGYSAAQDLLRGNISVPVTLFGRMRSSVGCELVLIYVMEGSNVMDALRKFFNYYPPSRKEALEVEWVSGERIDARGTPWLTVAPHYRPKFGWRVLLNGRDIAYLPEEDQVLKRGDSLQIFPPGR